MRAHACWNMTFDAQIKGAIIRSDARMAKLPPSTFHLRYKKMDDTPEEQSLRHR